MVQYGDEFGVEAVDESCGACFDGPVAFTGGQQFKQVTWTKSNPFWS